MAGKSILQKVFDALQLSIDADVNCELTPRQCKELLDHLESFANVSRERVDEILDALQYVDGPTQIVVESFKEYMFKGIETRACSYCGLLMPDDQTKQMSDHVKQCASNPLVKELGRLRGLILNWYTEWGQNGMHEAFHALMKEAKELERRP